MLLTILFVLWVLFIILIYLLADKERKLSFKEKYYLHIPSNYTPAETSCLINYGKISLNDLTATIIDLVQREILHIEFIIFDEIKLLVSRQSDFIIYKTELFDIEKNNLKTHELYLIKWLIETIGDGKKVYLSQIKNSARDKNGASLFGLNYEEWSSIVFQVSKDNNFFKPQKTGRLLGIFVCVFYIAIPVWLMNQRGSLSYLFLLILPVITIIYTQNVIKRTTYGQEAYELWMAFKRFLKESSNDSINPSALTDIQVLESYIPYSISLDAFTSFISIFGTRFSEEDFKNDSLKLLNRHSIKDISSFISTLNRITDVCLSASEKI